MSEQRPENLTDEVRAALAAHKAQTAPQQEQPPTGMVRYHLAVEEQLAQGVGSPKSVAAQLRAMADDLDPRQPAAMHRPSTRGEDHG